MRPFHSISVAIAAAVVLVSSVAAAEGDEKPTEYVVKRGDTCPSIAAAFYGDIKRIDLVHALNPNLGPVPHVLRPGQVLLLPPRATPALAAPDAKLTRVRNTVEVAAPNPRPGKPNDPLFRGNRVGTMASSAADVTFRDETQVKLGENTLVIIFGDTNASATRTNAAEATVVTGSLRARLSEIAGKKKDKPRVETPSGSVVMNDGEAKVSVDARRATRLAVYAGGSTVTAQKRTVPVSDGFGSKAEMGSAPTPPRPLPAAPVWTTSPGPLVLSDADVADVAGAFGAGQGAGDPAAEFHIQIARDAAFDDVLVDVRVPATTSALEAKRLPPGSYAARVSAIDADAFEGKWSSAAAFTVSRLTMRPLPHRRTSVETPEVGLVCALDGGAAQGFPIELDRNQAHSLSCTSAAGAGTLELDELPIRAVSASADMPRQSGRAGTLRVRLTDEADLPLDRLEVTAEPAEGLTVGRFERFAAPGVYVAPISWVRGTGPRKLTLRVAGTHVVSTNELVLPDGAVEEPPVKEPRALQLEVSLGAGAAARVFAHFGFAGFASVGVAAPLGSGVAFASLRGFAERYPTAAPVPEIIGNETSLARVRVDLAGAELALGYRFAKRSAPAAPYVVVAPLLARQLVETKNRTQPTVLLGAYGGMGLDLRAGPGGIFGEAGLRAATGVSGDESPVSPLSLFLSVGYRVGL